MGYLRLAISILFNVTGQLLLKRTAMVGSAAPARAAIYTPFLSVWFVLGVFCLGMGSVLWVTVLKKLPLTIAHPLTAIVFILVPIASHFLWAEPLPMMRLAGIAVIIGGVGLVARGG